MKRWELYLGIFLMLGSGILFTSAVLWANAKPMYTFIMVNSVDSLLIERHTPSGETFHYPLPAGSIIGFPEGKLPNEFKIDVTPSNRMLY